PPFNEGVIELIRWGTVQFDIQESPRAGQSPIDRQAVKKFDMPYSGTAQVIHDVDPTSRRTRHDSVGCGGRRQCSRLRRYALVWADVNTLWAARFVIPVTRRPVLDCQGPL